MVEPTLSEVHADLVGRLKHDERLRAVETQTATQQATLNGVITAMSRMEDRLVVAIQDAKPKNIHAWASVIVAVMALVASIVVYTSR